MYSTFRKINKRFLINGEENMKDIILPNYENCILNTITSILKYYNVKTEHKSLKELDEILQKNTEILFLLF